MNIIEKTNSQFRNFTTSPMANMKYVTKCFARRRFRKFMIEIPIFVSTSDKPYRPHPSKEKVDKDTEFHPIFTCYYSSVKAKNLKSLPENYLIDHYYLDQWHKKGILGSCNLNSEIKHIEDKNWQIERHIKYLISSKESKRNFELTYKRAKEFLDILFINAFTKFRKQIKRYELEETFYQSLIKRFENIISKKIDRELIKVSAENKIDYKDLKKILEECIPSIKNEIILKLICRAQKVLRVAVDEKEYDKNWRLFFRRIENDNIRFVYPALVGISSRVIGKYVKDQIPTYFSEASNRNNNNHCDDEKNNEEEQNELLKGKRIFANKITYEETEKVLSGRRYPFRIEDGIYFLGEKADIDKYFDGRFKPSYVDLFFYGRFYDIKKLSEISNKKLRTIYNFLQKRSFRVMQFEFGGIKLIPEKVANEIQETLRQEDEKNSNYNSWIILVKNENKFKTRSGARKKIYRWIKAGLIEKDFFQSNTPSEERYFELKMKIRNKL